MTDLLEAGFQDSGTLGAPAAIAESRWVVMKFGGTSVSTAERWQTIAGLVRSRLDAGLKPVIVHSALKGVSNSLEGLLLAAGQEDPAPVLAEIRRAHYALAEDLGVDGPALLDESMHELEQLFAGVKLLREASVRVRVRIMALGELMATRLGAAFLEHSGVPTQWMDARELLQSAPRSGVENQQDFLSAVCGFEPDAALAESLAESGKVILTQGFIARNRQGQTVLLGRGGSDTSAAYFASRLQAHRLEIFTDVPGMFTADPRIVPSARLLVSLRYDEAQELASAGSTVLHPRCLSPVRQYGIPLFVRCTDRPELPGTVVSPVTEETETQVKGICIRGRVTLISMDSVGMWHEVGFLSRAFSVFSEHRVSIDLVSTSETNVTVSIDTAFELTRETLDALVSDLLGFCRVSVIENCSAVSLVGRKIRTILPRLAPALEVFEEERIHLMSQSANDLNLTFVVDREQGTRLVRKLHDSIIRKRGGSKAFGASWDALFGGESSDAPAAEPPWWHAKREELLAIADSMPNAYVYDLDSVKQAAEGLKALRNVDRVLYAMKANFNADILKALEQRGVDFECVSPGEVNWLRDVIPDLDTDRILFTPNFAPRGEYDWAFAEGLRVTLDNLYPLEAWPQTFKGREIIVRLDPGQGRGHHDHVKTAGVHSKFGIPLFEVEELKRQADKAGAIVVGMHAHTGSGILDPLNWRKVAGALIEAAQQFSTVRSIDLGGGIGVPEKTGDRAFDLGELDELLAEVKATYPQYELWLEPGRYLVAQAGILLTRVTQVKGKGEMKYIGVGTGMNSLIRPALYGSYHEIINLTRADESASETVTVVGPICETGDRLGTDRLLPPSSEGDVIIIANAGAYGRVMSSEYNRRDVAAEVTI